MRVAKTIMMGASMLALLACQGQTNTASETTMPAKADTMQSQDVNAQLDAWFANFEKARINRFPEQLTSRGLKTKNDQWNDGSRAFYLDELDRHRTAMEDMKEMFDRDALSPQHQLSYDLFIGQTERRLAGKDWYYHSYPFNQMFGVHSGVPTFLLNNHKVDSVADAKAYISRLKQIDTKLGTVIDYSQQSFDKGIAPPKFVYPHLLRDIDNIMSGAPFEDTDKLNLMLADFKTKTDKLDLPDAEKEALYSEAITALQDVVGPTYAALRAEMVRQQAAATTDDGAWKLPDGDAFYQHRLNLMTTTDMSPTEIHDLGLAEVERIQNEMRDIMKTVEFDGTLKEFFEFMRSDAQFFYMEDGGRERYLAEATEFIDIMKGQIDTVFINKPKADMEVRAVEAFREQSAGKAFYSRPAADGSRPGYYYANLYRMEDMPTYQMEALAYHEGIPGHHMQLAIAQELEGIPDFRKYGRYTAYSEGWGLYSEYLPKEMGFYEDPYSDFGRLAMEIWRAARLVVDTGLHDKKWTREKAIQYLIDNTPNPEGDAVKAIERYIVMPGQATAYKVGMIKILELRDKAEAALGDAYDIREFHNVVLGNGPVPLSTLEDQIDAYIAKTKAG